MLHLNLTGLRLLFDDMHLHHISKQEGQMGRHGEKNDERKLGCQKGYGIAMNKPFWYLGNLKINSTYPLGISSSRLHFLLQGVRAPHSDFPIPSVCLV
jgi:hypothetical protein